jgi:hypothetical protein
MYPEQDSKEGVDEEFGTKEASAKAQAKPR